MQVNNYGDGPLVAQSASGLPPAYGSYAIGTEFDTFARVRQWSAYRLEENSLTWVVEAVYSTPESKEGNPNSGGNTGTGNGTYNDTAGSYADPTLELPQVKTWLIEREAVVSRVYNLATGLFNFPQATNCEIYDPPIMRKDALLGLSITRNEPVSTIHPALSVQYGNSINTDTFWGLGPAYWRCIGITAERQTKQIQGGTTYAFLKCTYEFHAHPDSWLFFALDAGN